MLSGDKPYPKGKYYVMPMFPYPSGDSMHVGHASNYIINDFVARYKKMQGYDVIHPMGFDSFGLPTENYAIKTGKSARQATKDNIVNFKEQIKAINLQFDPEREFATSDPEYYKRTQWIFARLFEHGLAYKKDGLVNRCNGCQTVLANDQVVDGKCERCETVIIQKKHPQRYIKTTALADELIDDLDDIDRPEETKTIQKNWIGRSFGAEIDFGVVQKVQNIQVVQNIQKVQSFSEKNNGEEYDEKTKIIIGIAIEVHKKYKDTITESQIRDIIFEKLKKADFKVEKEKKIQIVEEGIKIGNRYIDLVIDDDIFIELKKNILDKEEEKGYRQLRNYLDLNKRGCGILLNFAYAKLKIRRLNYFDSNTKNSNTLQDLNTSEISEPSESLITVFTTRPDTLYGVTALVLAPENQIIDDLLSLEKKNELEIFRSEVAKLTSIDRQSTERQKNGMFSGVYVTHPLTNEQIPVWFADYVLIDYATGAVMMVPAHDERDREFAKRYGITVKWVINPQGNNRDQNIESKSPSPSEWSEAEGTVGRGSGGGYINDIYTLTGIHKEKLMSYAKELRKKGTNGEKFVWELLRDRKYKDLKWRRQHPIGNYIADFYNSEYGTVIEIDGPQHNEQKEYDKSRDMYMDNLGIKVIRISSEVLYEEPATLFEEIDRITNDPHPDPLPTAPASPTLGEGDSLEGLVPKECHAEEGFLINSSQFDGLDNDTAKAKITEYLESLGVGRKKTTFRLRDRSVSRQRYRGSPIPVYYTFEDNEKVPYFGAKEGIGLHEGKPIVTRKVVKVAIKHWSEDKFLIIKNDKLDWHFVAGGLNDGEDREQAAIREAIEETPYTNFKIITHINSEVHSCFYNLNKNENRYLIEQLVVIKLLDNQESKSEELEKNNYTFERLDPESIGERLAYNNEKYNWFEYFNPNKKPTPPKQIDRYNAYNPHPDKSKRIPHLIPDEELPVILPLDLPNYKPAGKSPLEDHPTFKYYEKKISFTEKYIIKDHTSGDIDFIYQEHVREFHTDLWGATHSKEVVQGWLDEEDCICKIVLINKNSIGYMMCFPTNSMTNWLQKTFNYDLINTFSINNINIGSCIWLAETVTIESKRGKGVFSQLLQSIINDTYFLGYTYCGLCTLKQKPELVSFYEKKGRKIVDEFAHDGKEYVIMIGKLDDIKRIHYEREGKVSNVVFLHGYEGNNETRSLIEAQCKEYGIECYNPSLINSNSPDLDTHLDQIIHEYGDKINENTIILGHSLGGITAQQLISKLNKKIKKLVLLGSSYPRTADRDSDPILLNYRNTELNTANISRLCESIEFWFNKDDPAIPHPGAYEFYKEHYKNATFRIFENEGHFFNKDSMISDARRKINYNLEELGIIFKDTTTYLRECDTLDTFMCSSFYFLRYLDPANTSHLISHEAAANMPVDLYIGGKEHAVGHLIYSRFIYKFLVKYGYVDTEAKEPFVKLIHQGMVHASDGRKFSKRRGNGINPLDVVKEHNTDTLRTYLAFMGPIELPKNWNPDGVAGVGRFLKRFEKLVEFIHNQSDTNITSIIHQTIKAVGEDMDNLKFNTAISKLMIATNAIYEKGQIDSVLLQNLILLLAPFAPDTAQRMWTAIGQDGDVTKQPWPTYDSQLIHTSTIDLPIQINGKTKGTLSVSKDITQDEAITLVRQDEKMSRYLEGGIKKIIRVPGRICNIIV